jgi:integrase
MTEWRKVEKAPYYLEIWEGPYRTSYRVNWRGEGHNLRKRLDGEFRTWKDALKLADRLISEARFGKKSGPKNLVRSEDLCDEIVKLKESKAPATYQQTEIFFRVHIKPFLNDHCPYAADLNPTVWLNYKNALRLKNPTVRLFNHWKFFTMLFRYAHEKGILPAPVRLAFSEEREDSRAKGHVIPDEELERLTVAASKVWRDRIVVQRRTGMRPGEVRHLRKDRIRVVDGGVVVILHKEDTKTRTAREFMVTAPDAVEVLVRRSFTGDGAYLFPMETDKDRPMDKHLNGWRAALKKAALNPHYTPHDIRHTYASRMFQRTRNHVALCYQLGMSIEEAQRTYIHISLQDTGALADIAAGDAEGIS